MVRKTPPFASGMIPVVPWVLPPIMNPPCGTRSRLLHSHRISYHDSFCAALRLPESHFLVFTMGPRQTRKPSRESE